MINNFKQANEEYGKRVEDKLNMAHNVDENKTHRNPMGSTESESAIKQAEEKAN